MATVWDKFWISQGKNMEWDQKTILHSKSMNNYFHILKNHFKQKDLNGLSLLELGSGLGITSMYFATKGAKVTLLDLSPEVEDIAKEYWKGYAKHTFICKNLFEYSPNKKYDIVTSFGLCEHFVGDMREKVLQKHIDLMNDNGIAIISVPHKYGIFYRMAKALAETLGFWGFGLEVPFSRRELIEFARKRNLKYSIMMGGFYSSAYDLIVRKPLKALGIASKRRFDETTSIFDRPLGSGLVILLKKK